ncbi:MAG: type II secretion system F family protein [Oscillospiraceae bacterium]|nr:type II secretion system F family protein [Oscillospiraceae bacterium]MBQ3050152.1 type II secretion system F family protein [Oscillospiraceae bacterium]MBQ9938506.1 type II secretion system F family protein [Oscillospiraceae bacterium]
MNKKPLELNDGILADLFHQLALLMHSGIRLDDALMLLSDEEEDERFSGMLKNTAEALETGVPFYQALEETQLFPSHVTGLLKMSEYAGRTQEALEALAADYENKDRLRRSLTRAFAYPSLLLLMMMVVIAVLLIKVFPIFNEVYASLGGSLTGIAALLLKAGDIFGTILPYIGILFAVVLIFVLIVQMMPALNKKITDLVKKLFGDRGVMRKINNAYFARAFAMALAAGLPIEEGLSLASTLLQDRPYALARCEKALKAMENGTEVVTALKEAELLTPAACRLLSVGLLTGSADSVMDNIAERMTAEAEEALEGTVAKIEPVMVLVTSLMVGAILLSVMLPLTNIMNTIG